MVNYNRFFIGRSFLPLEQDLLKQRLARIHEIEAPGYRGYGRRYDFSHSLPQILEKYSSMRGKGGAGFIDDLRQVE